MAEKELSQMDLIQSLRHLPLPMPKDLAQIFQLLGLYDPKEGLSKLLDRIRPEGIRPRQVYTAVLLRAPDNIALATPAEGYDGRRHLRATLESPEFQRSAMRNFLKLHSDKQRQIFIHVPKCAGTDLVLNLAPNRLSFPKVLTRADWVSSEELIAALSGLVRAAPFYEQLFVYGHMTIGDYIDVGGVRASDEMFTVIRDPVELLLSQANYAAGRLRQDPGITTPDTIEIMAFLGLDRLQDERTPAYWKMLATQCLTEPRICPPNRICHYLGKEQIATYECAIEHILRYDIEVTETSRYRRWLDERWGIQASSRHNGSEKLLTTQEARRFFSDQIRSATSEDQKLFNVIRWVLKKTGRSSTRGSEIVEIAGKDSVFGLPETLANEDPPGRARVFVSEGVPAIEHLQAPLPAGSTDLSMITVSEYTFHNGGNGGEVRREGWAVPEREFTWTNAGQAIIDLPRPEDASDYILRIHCAPFVANGVLPVQRIIILVNDEEIGVVRSQDRSILDCDLPWSILAGRDQITISLQFPDAAQPISLGIGDDQRLLGAAVRSVSLGRLVPASEVKKTGSAEELRERDLQDLAMMFESIGENCEFGLVQRRCGAEPLGLFRFSSTPLPKLLNALKAKFNGLGKAARSIEVQVSATGKEYMVLDKCFGFLFHAWVMVGEQEPAVIAKRELRRLPLLIRKLVEEMTRGEKIFVFHGMTPLTLEDARALSAALRDYGPVTLLWVELADDTHEPGTAEQIEPGLLKGYMDRFAPGENAHDLSFDCWLTLCRNTIRLVAPAPEASVAA